MKKILTIIFLFLTVFIKSSFAEDAQDLFKFYKKTIYQILVIELASGNKSTIGSGFQITEEGYIATNFHVVSYFILNPDKYKLEYIQHDGKSGDLEVLGIDVIHDLAIVKKEKNNSPFLNIFKNTLSKGTKIFSLGNPYDLGMTIVEGSYSGLLENSLYEKILFSGSLNPGMSGGPSIDVSGEVVGVNVSTKGNQISFLVPAPYLAKLLGEVLVYGKTTDLKSSLEEQLVDNQDNYISSLMNSKWKLLKLGNAQIPGEMSDVFKCWGDTDKESESLYVHTYINCSTDDAIFIHSNLRTGRVKYSYHWYQEKGLSRFNFYNMYQREYVLRRGFNFAAKEDLSEYTCNSDFINISGKDWKTAFCVRQYKNYKSLYDVFFNMALVSENDRGLITVLSFSGVTKEMALDFTKKFVENISWQN